MDYPKEITPKILADSSHISIAQMRSDISDAKREIKELERKIEGYTLLAVPSTPEGKMAQFRLTGAKQMLIDTREQLAFIELLLAARENST